VGRAGKNTTRDLEIPDSKHDTQTLALHVSCGAALGLPQIWPGEEEVASGDKRVPSFNTLNLSRGHKLSFKDSLKAGHQMM
jgi:hypothetical protein